ncbi:MAG: hypothetical protein ACYCU3_14235 [Streptosporangiaceae bacterium]
MSIVFNVILQILLLGSLLLFVVVLLGTALAEKTSTLERFLRVAAIFAGAMVAVGAASSGVGYATFIVNALSSARPASAFLHVITTVVPALIGSGIGFYLVRTIRKSETLAIRIFGFVGMLATTAFIEVYAEAASRNGFRLGAAALPNIGFTAGVILTVVFTLRTDGSGRQDRHSSLGLLASLLRRSAPAGQSSARHLAPGRFPDQGATDQGNDQGLRGL